MPPPLPQVTADTCLDSLLDSLNVDDGSTAGELRLPLDTLLAASALGIAAQSTAGQCGGMVMERAAAQAEGGVATARCETQHRMAGLLVRQLLAKYELDTRAGLKAIAAFFNSDGSPPESANSSRATVEAAAAAGFAHHFAVSPCHAAVLVRFFTGDGSTPPSYRAARAAEPSPGALLCDALRALPDTAVEFSQALILYELISHAEMAEIAAAAAALAPPDAAPAAAGVDLSAYPHHVRFGSAHVALYLHRGGHFARACPALCRKLLQAMRSHVELGVAPDVTLCVRSIELHTYAAGDGLMTVGHRDQGSMLTMSVLLSEPTQYGGGTFLTCDPGNGVHDDADGMHVYHHLSQGDAILFRSEKMHNVAPVTRGIRQALVIELWEGSTNATDRHS